MKALVLTRLGQVDERSRPLLPVDMATPAPADDELLIRVAACGVCHTELDEIEGRLAPSRLPRVLGHQIVGRVLAAGRNTSQHQPGDRVGVAWIFRACGRCEQCRHGRENLCPRFEATGRDADGGYAEFVTVPDAFAYAIPPVFSDVEAAPLLCAGAIGYRSLALASLQDGEPLGLMGFGASAHLVIRMARQRHPRSPVYVFARSEEERTFAAELGAAWTGDITSAPPALPAAIIDTTPAWTPVVNALEHLQPGGRLVINAIRKEAADRHVLADIDYATHLWQEKELKSVANVTRRDVREFLDLAATMELRPDIQVYPFERANQALVDLKMRRIRGAKVVRVAAGA
jgi:propanol-preferring alcohol dehydrogenase